jgi:hypothetical protein
MSTVGFIGLGGAAPMLTNLLRAPSQGRCVRPNRRSLRLAERSRTRLRSKDLIPNQLVSALLGLSRSRAKLHVTHSKDKNQRGEWVTMHLKNNSKVSIRLEYAVTSYGKIQLLGEEHAHSHRNAGAIVASTPAFGLTGFIVSWNTAVRTVMEENTPLVATVASDFDLPLPPSSR